MSNTKVKLIGIFLLVTLVVFAQRARADERVVKIVQPASNARLTSTGVELTSPVKVCMEVQGLVVEKAGNGVNEGKGHHHLLLNSLPADLSQPLAKEEIHMGDGSKCRDLELSPGRHVIYTVFAYGNHVPYDPTITDQIIITIRKD